MNPQPLSITIFDLPRYIKVSLEGRLDSDTSPAVEKQLKEILSAKPKNVLVDLEKLNYISSAGLRVVTFALKTAKSYGGNLQIARMQPQIRKVFDIVGLVPVNQIFSSIEELDAYLDKMQRGDG
jgi:anti-anti-sigma factor